MEPRPLDEETANRLLAGWIASEDAPPGYGPVVRLLDASAAEVAAEELVAQSSRTGRKPENPGCDLMKPR
jgi:hypothetical protein